MTYADANIQFDKMAPDSKARIISIFDSLCRENTMNVREAFVAAVADECTAIETKKQLRYATGPSWGRKARCNEP